MTSSIAARVELMSAKPLSDFRVLLVDDDSTILKALERVLRSRFDVTAALGPAEALQTLKDRGQFDCVISDLSMPGMSGIVLMGHVRTYFPDVVRVMLTGSAEVPDVVKALNDDLIFRFLMKPSTSDELIGAVEAAARYSKLIRAERELLQGTWKGSVTALLEVLALVQPRSFGRADRLARMVESWLSELNIGDPWMAVIACKLTQLGAAGIPASTLERMDAAEVLTEAERTEVAQMPVIAERLLQHIPRLEQVRALLLEVANLAATPSVPAAAIRLAIELDMHISRGETLGDTMREIRKRVNAYPDELITVASAQSELFKDEREVFLCDVQAGMIFATDVISPKALLLAARGQMVTDSIVQRVRSGWREFARDTRVRVETRALSTAGDPI